MREKLLPILAELQSLGYQLDDILCDGEWHTFSVSPSDRKKSGSYRATQSQHLVKIYVKNFKNADLDKNYVIEMKELTPEEREQYERELKEIDDKRGLKKQMMQQTAANEAYERFKNFEPAASHPYLKKKKLKDTYGTKIHLNSLIIPMYDIDGKFWNYQAISPEGDRKEFCRDAKKNGCFYVLGNLEETGTLFICEGFATSASLHEATRQAVACAFDSGNLKNVAIAFRHKYPKLNIIVAGDADQAGIKHSRAAAAASDSTYLIPEFTIQHPSLTDWNDLAEHEGEGTVQMQAKDTSRAQKIKNEKIAYIEGWLEKHEVQIRLDNTIRVNGEKTKFRFLMNQILIDGFVEKVALPERLLKGYLENWVEAKKREEFARLTAPLLEYHSNEELKKFLHALVDRPSAHAEAVFRHFIWQVKRKLANLPVVHHMMPVFTGKTGGGKSYAIRKVIEPLQELQWEQDMTIFGDKREYGIFEDAYVIFFDEMQKADKTDLSGIKRVITANRAPYREMYTHSFNSAEIKTTFIGTTNERLVDLIKDPYTNRRFYEFLCRDKADWDTINTVDYVKLWQSVDINEPCPILEYFGDIQKEQSDTKYKTPIGEWVAEVGLVADETNFIATQKLFDMFKDWAERCNYGKYSIRTFSLELRNIHEFPKGDTSYARGYKVRMTKSG